MNRRKRARYRTQLCDDLLERILLRKHVKQVCPPTNHILNPRRAKEVSKPHSIDMTVSLHLEDEFTNVPEAEAAVPTRISQQVISLSEMRVSSLPRPIPMDRRPPALIIQHELKRI